ncbi:helix-turn-helix transcriptional regulator [Leucobacter chromiireducens]|uniref:helix-turn-helix transcriptional regulator n=1 Tax=Leucobacter chromiireducens TaxID=283877 RepID=UPI000F62E98F|nr:helix-turn-helix transcriptional regulator [Leucobacter chromiireducens]
MAEAQGTNRGVLYPHRLPEFHRIAPTAELAPLVRWLWIPEWAFPPGVVSRQEVLPFPACNLVVEPDGVTLVGPPTTRSERELRGAGWAVGALLRPAAVPALCPDPASIRDTSIVVDAAELHAAVHAAMAAERPPAQRRAAAAELLSAWLLARVPQPDAEAELANRLAELLADPAVTRVDQLAAQLHASTRTLQRIAARYFGLSLHRMIQRRRIQEAAASLRGDEAGSGHPGIRIAELAHALGYTDHAHFSTDFKAVLGLTPSDYRARAQAPAQAPAPDRGHSGRVLPQDGTRHPA